MTQSQPPSDELMREQRLQRNLKIVVAVLGGLIFVGLGVIAVRIVSMAGSSGTATSRPVSSAPAGAPASLELPRGAKIVSVSLSGNRLAVHHDGPSGPGITVIDTDTGKRLLDLKQVEATPRD